MKPGPYRQHHVVLWGLFILAFALRAWDLPSQPPLDDEVASAFSADNYFRSGLLGQVMWYHPHLRNVLVFLSGSLFGGYSAWGLRFGSLLLGSLSVPLLGYLANALFRKREVAYLAAFFICIDPLHITASREAFQEAITIFFVLSAVLAAFHAIEKERDGYVYLSGVLFGLAASSKWHGVFPLAVSALAYLLAPHLIRDFRGEKRPLARLLTVFAAFGAIPMGIYVAVYIPWILRGYSLAEFLDFQLWLVKHQYYYVSTPYTEYFMSIRAYEWFIMPTAWVEFVFHQGKSYVNVAMGNFLVWVLTLPALYFTFMKWLRDKQFAAGYLLALFFAAYLPLLLTTRSIWVYLPPVVQYAFIFIAYAISELQERGRISKRVLAAYLVIVVTASALMYPMATFRTLEYPYLKQIAEMYNPHPGGGHR